MNDKFSFDNNKIRKFEFFFYDAWFVYIRYENKRSE